MPSISKAIRQEVSARAHYCCEYCKTQEQLIGMPLVIDHVIPTAMQGTDKVDNLAAACYRCNQFKGARVSAVDPQSGEDTALFDPRSHIWLEHFCWADEGLYIEGITITGRATVVALKLNNAYVTASRKIWIAEDWHPPHFQRRLL